MKIENQEIIVGSSYLRDSNKESFNRIDYMLKHMQFNTALISKILKKLKRSKKNIIKKLTPLKTKFYNLRLKTDRKILNLLN